MPAIAKPSLALTLEEVSAGWGARRTRLDSPRMRERISEILARMEAEHWLQARASYGVREVTASGPGWMEVAGGLRVHAPSLSHRLRGATHLAAGVCTLGAALENQVSAWFASGDRLRAVILDDIGTLALYHLGAAVEQRMHEDASLQGLDWSGVLSPGDDDFDLRDQKALLGIADGAAIGVSLTGTCMLSPRKSVTAVMGFGKKMLKWSREETCATCKSRARCPHRALFAEAIAP